MIDKKNIFYQFFKFGIVGISNTAISLGIYYFLIYLSVNYIIANSLGFIASVFNAYYWNNKYVFNKTQIGNFKPLIKTFIAYGFTFLLSNYILFIFIEVIKISKLVAPIICLIITIPLNFIINKFWTFK